MGLGTIIKILIGLFLFSVFGSFFNYVFYYFFYSIKIVYSGFNLVFGVLGASDISLKAVYYVLIFGIVYLLVSLIKKFLYR